jgi:hypothetical protein
MNESEYEQTKKSWLRSEVFLLLLLFVIGTVIGNVLPKDYFKIEKIIYMDKPNTAEQEVNSENKSTTQQTK